MHQDFSMLKPEADKIPGQKRLATVQIGAKPFQLLQFGSAKTDP
jgi:hypothetical protein